MSYEACYLNVLITHSRPVYARSSLLSLFLSPTLLKNLTLFYTLSLSLFSFLFLGAN